MSDFNIQVGNILAYYCYEAGNSLQTQHFYVDGVKKFQTWLDSKHGGWHSKYGTLNNDTLKGWGKYGPNTTKAWSQYKDEYLNGSAASGTETPNPSAEVDVTKPSGIPGSPDMVGKSGLNLDVNRIKEEMFSIANKRYTWSKIISQYQLLLK